MFPERKLFAAIFAAALIIPITAQLANAADVPANVLIEPATCGVILGPTSSQSLDFGQTVVGQIKPPNSADSLGITLVTTGNSPLDVLSLTGTDWVHPIDTTVVIMESEQTHMAVVASSAYSEMAAIPNPPTYLSVAPSGTPPNTARDFFFRLQVDNLLVPINPAAVTPATQTMTFTALC